MDRFLDIIIPQYNENEELVKRLLNSILDQNQVNFNEIGVIIVNDGSDEILSKEFLDNYKDLNIQYIKNKKNLGQGPTEQNGINHSKAKYITFVDADDELIPNRLHYAIDTLKKHNFNILLSHFIEEIYINGKTSYFTHKIDLLHYLHGVFIKKEYLDVKNIKFSDEIRYCEDTYFTRILFMQSPEPPILAMPIYLWKYNKDSLMRSNNLIKKIYDDLFKSLFLSYEYLIKVENKKENEYMLLSGFFDLFVKLESNQFDKRRLNKQEKELYAKYLEYKDIFDKYKDLLNKFYDSELLTNKEVFKDFESNVSFDSFLKKMEN